MDYIAALDLGSTSLKACIYDLDGNCVASASRPTEKINPSTEHPEWVIWDPEQIWGGSSAALKEAVSKLDDASLVRAIAVTGMGMDGVPIDADGNHLYPFISWHDPRTAPQAEWWNEKIGAERTFEIAGFPSWPITAVMRILWMKEHEPEIMSRAVKWLLIEDFLNHKLCGEIATDFTMASCMLLLDQAKLQWSDELIEASGVSKSLLPTPRRSGTPLGGLTPAAAEATGLTAGTKVILGGQDHICGTLPVGAYKPGTLLDVVGTWENVIASIPSAVTTPRVRDAGVCMQAHVVEGLYAAWGGAPSGESLEWFRKQFGGEAESKAKAEGGEVWDYLLAELEGTKPGAAGVTYLPHISAAGCPINDPQSLGAFVGISNTATRADMLRAVIEGGNFQFLEIIQALESALDCKFESIIVVGGSTRNEFLLQNKADMIGLPIEVSPIAEASPLGTAILAGLGAGLYPDMDTAFERVKKPGKVLEPNKELTEFYSKCYETYKMVYPALKPVSHRVFGQFKK